MGKPIDVVGRAVMCIYCGQSIPYAQPDGDNARRVREAAVAHDAVCTFNPLVAALRDRDAEIANLRARLDWLCRHENTRWITVPSGTVVVWPDTRDDPDGSDDEYIGASFGDAIDAARGAQP